MRGMTLVRTWLQLYADRGQTKADALRDLNKKLGTKYQHSNLSRWERGERDPGQDARVEMMRVVLPHVLKEHGGQQVDVKAALEKLR